MVTTQNLSAVFDRNSMQARKAAYFQFVQRHAPHCFTPDARYREEIDPDRRITFWIFPALLASDDPAMRDFAMRLYAQDPCWAHWEVFITSSIAGNLMRERERMSPALVQRSEDYLARFAEVERGRKPCSGANDYMFHGYNDNMPAMSTRALIFAGDILDRQDLTDHGLFFLEGLCANFARRGLLSEYNSSTYTPITLVSLMDIAECSYNREAREMAEACANRVLLDMVAHWHPELGAPAGSSSRAYLPDMTLTISTQNALMWYLGFPGTIDPTQIMDPRVYDGPVHHGPNPVFLIAQFCECFSPAFTQVRPELIEFARAPREYPYEVRATMDSGKAGSFQARTYSQPQWALGTCSGEMWAGASGQHLTLRGIIARHPQPSTWRDRVAFWHYVNSGGTDLGDQEPSYGNSVSEATAISDSGQYHTVQQQGSALVLGHIGTSLLDKEVATLKLVMAFSTFNRLPDEMLVNDTPLDTWEGTASATDWHFLRFGEVYVGIRAAGMLLGAPLPVQRVLQAGYLRLEVPALNNQPTRIDREFRKWLDWGYVVEMASQEECTFAQFRQECRQTAWEYFHGFYRTSRYQGRHGELQIVDSIDPEGVRFLAIDGQVEETSFFTATGMDPALVQLFPDGHRVRQRRLAFHPDFFGSPFYDTRYHILASDVAE